MATSEGPNPAQNAVNNAPDGIPRTAVFLALDKDMSTMIFRRFHQLSTRNLLFLEGRVAGLQRYQRRLDHDNNRGQPGDIIEANKSWEDFALLGTGGGSRDGTNIPSLALTQWLDSRSARNRWPAHTTLSLPNDKCGLAEQAKCLGIENDTLQKIQDKWDIALAVQDALKEYQEAVLRYRKISSIAPPAERSLSTIQKWFNPPGDLGRVIGTPFLEASAMNDLFHVPLEETMALHIPADDDPVSKGLSRWTWFTDLARQPMVPGFSWTPEKFVHDTVTWITLGTAVVFLVGATWALWGAEHTHFTVRLAVLTIFVILFASWIGKATNASRAEVFGATAAYAAVLVVFVGKG